MKTITVPNGFSFPMIEVPGGTFTQGPREVTLSDFELGQYPVTQALWEAVMGEGSNPSRFEGPRRPVERVSWYDVVAFCNRLNASVGQTCCYCSDAAHTKHYAVEGKLPNEGPVYYKPTANAFRLPTEAEWEYAALGGQFLTKTKYAGSDRVKDVGWYDNKNEKGTQCVGLLQPNALGLHDLTGNVEEWCWDLFHHSYPKYNETNPTGPPPKKGGRRVTRGGSRVTDPKLLILAERRSTGPDYREGNFGFRLARHSTLPPQPADIKSYPNQ